MIRNHILFTNKKGVFENFISVGPIKLSVADGCVIIVGLVISLIISGIINGGSKNIEVVNILISSVPFVISLLLSIKKEPIVPLYVTIWNLFHLKKEKKLQRKGKKNTKKSKSMILGFANELRVKDVNIDDIPMEYICDDLNIPKRQTIKLYKDNGDKLVDTLIKVYLDSILIDEVKTSLDGQLQIDITPKTYGKKQLVLKDQDDNIVHKKELIFLQNTL